MTFIQSRGLTPEGQAVSIPVAGQFGFTNDLLDPDEVVTLMWRDPEGNILGEWVPTDPFASLKYNIQSDQPGMFQIEYSQDAKTVGFTPGGRDYDTNPRLFQAGLDPKLKYARLRFRNTGSVRQSTFTFEGRLSPGLIQPTVSSLNSDLLGTNLGQVSASVLYNPNGDGTFSPAGLNLLANSDNQTNGEQKTQIVNEEPIRVQLPLDTTITAIIDPTEPLSVQGKVSIQEEGDEPLRVVFDTPITVQAPDVNVEAPIVNIPPAEITVIPASVNFPDKLGIDDSTPIKVEVMNQVDPIINVAAPNITIEPTPVTVEAPIVNVPAPVVNVEPTPVTVEAPIVNVPAPVVNVAPTPVTVNFPTSQNVTLVNGNNQTVGNTDRPLTVNIANQPTTQQVSGNVNATIQGTPTVNANVTFPTTQPISASSLPLPTSASTSALQTAGNTSLNNIDLDLGSLADVAVANPASSGSVIALLKGILSLQIGYSTTANQTTVSASTAGVQALAANPNRRNAFITNTTSIAVNIYYGAGTTARVATLTSIGAYWEMNPDLYRGVITVKSSSGTPVLEVVETT